MISVTVRVNDTEVGYLEIVHERLNEDGTADYSIKVAVERGRSVGVHWRNIYKFPRSQYNVLALVKQVLETLDEKELTLDRDFAPDSAEAKAALSSNMARRLRSALQSF